MVKSEVTVTSSQKSTATALLHQAAYVLCLCCSFSSQVIVCHSSHYYTTALLAQLLAYFTHRHRHHLVTLWFQRSANHNTNHESRRQSLFPFFSSLIKISTSIFTYFRTPRLATTGTAQVLQLSPMTIVDSVIN